MPTYSAGTLGGPLGEISMSVTLWQTLAVILDSLGFAPLNRNDPPFLLPTAHYLRESD